MSGKERNMIDMVPNLKISKADMPKKVIVCGDPERAVNISKMLKDTKLIGKNREYYSYAGTWNNEVVAVVSHGVGGPGAAVCFEELAMAGAEVMIRVGTAGSYQKEIEPGSLVISTAAVSRDGLSSQIAPAGFPAVANRHIVSALAIAAESKGLKVFEGITLTLDAFYTGSNPFSHEAYKQSNVLAVEMEIAALFTIASLRNFKAGAILAIDGYADADLMADYNPHTNTVKQAIEEEAVIALDALCTL